MSRGKHIDTDAGAFDRDPEELTLPSTADADDDGSDGEQ